jgi:hypothetical protein
MSRKANRWLGVVSILFAVSVALASTWYLRMRRPPNSTPLPTYLPDDPRLLYRGPFTNIHPDVAYTNNDNLCVPCHADHCASYRLHPMARSLEPMADRALHEILDAKHHNPFSALGFRFSLTRRGQDVWHHLDGDDASGRAVVRTTFPVHFAIGSGTRGRSYLTNREGFLFQTPISWFAQKQIWDLSPGFDSSLLSGRPVDGRCLFCHANRVHFRENSVNHFEEPIFSGMGIGCERCHGPAERHVATSAKFDIVNPSRLSAPELRDSVCEQCHLKGKMRVLRRGRGLNDFRPGLPLSQFFRVFVESASGEGKAKSVSEAEQMHESRCYRATIDTDRPLVCVSCHDPHRFIGPSERVAHYRARCLHCHESLPCRLEATERHRRQADDSCIACHMPRFGTADIVHTAATDHRIPRLPSPKPDTHAGNEPFALKPFHPVAPDEEAELHRDLGLAWVGLMRLNQADPQTYGELTEDLLAPAVREHADDVSAREALGLSLLLRHRDRDALAVLETTLSFDPHRELALNGAASIALGLGRPEESLLYWRRLVAENPWQPTYRRALTQLLVRLGDKTEARKECQAWLRLDPIGVDARRTWIYLLLRDKKQSEAREQLHVLEALKAPDLDRVRAWFEEGTH